MIPLPSPVPDANGHRCLANKFGDGSLIFRDDKVYLPIVRDNRLNLIAVDLGHDDGYTVEVSGDHLRAGDLVAMNVGEAAHNGEPVQPVGTNQQNM